MKKLHAQWLEDLEIGQGRSAKTAENYDRYLQRFYEQQKISKVADITAEAVRVFRLYLNESAPRPGDISEQGVSLATQNYHLIALRQFLKYLARQDVKALSPDKVGLAKLHEREIDVLYPEEVDALLAAAQSQVTSDESRDLAVLRDVAILETLYSTGLRVSELISLDRDDVRDSSNEIVVRGKGNKVRVVFLSGAAREALGVYVAERDDIDAALFARHGPNVADASDLRLSPRTVQRVMKKYAALAGLTKDVSPHTFRHSFATDLLANGADVRAVQELLGHASITTTQIYTHLTDVQLREVHEKYHRKG